MKVLRRLLANFVDIAVFLAIVMGMFIFVLPFFVELVGVDEGSMVLAVGVFVVVPVLTFAVQYPFMAVGQTIGKALFGLRIVSTNKRRPVSVSVIVQRELFAKVMSCYLLCLPVFYGRVGKHEEATETAVE